MTLDELILELEVFRTKHGCGALQVEHGGNGGGIARLILERDAARPEGVVVLYDGP